jgi:hypothetical protein
MAMTTSNSIKVNARRALALAGFILIPKSDVLKVRAVTLRFNLLSCEMARRKMIF